MTGKALFEPYTLGSLTLSNRIVMAPLTRNRADPGFVSGDLAMEYIANNGYDLQLAASRLAEGKADLFAFGRPFIANPDLVERLKTRAPLAELNPATLYGGSAGYTDYPAIAASSRP